jgi:hypothetical protein
MPKRLHRNIAEGLYRILGTFGRNTAVDADDVGKSVLQLVLKRIKNDQVNILKLTNTNSHGYGGDLL